MYRTNLLYLQFTKSRQQANISDSIISFRDDAEGSLQQAPPELLLSIRNFVKTAHGWKEIHPGDFLKEGYKKYLNDWVSKNLTEGSEDTRTEISDVGICPGGLLVKADITAPPILIYQEQFTSGFIPYSDVKKIIRKDGVLWKLAPVRQH